MFKGQGDISAGGWRTGGEQPAVGGLSFRLAWPAVVSAAFLLALALRLYHLGDRSFWVDESGTWGYASLAPADLIGRMGKLELTPPGYYLAMRLWMQLGGEGEWWLRLPAAVLGAAAVLPFALFLRRAAGPAAACWGAALLAVAGMELRYSQEARVYAVLFFLFTCGLLLMEGLLRQARAGGAGMWWRAVALALLCGAMMHLHFTAVIPVATLFAYAAVVLWQEGRFRPAVLLPFLAAGTGALLLAVPVFILGFAIAANQQSAAHILAVPDLGQAWFEYRNVLLAPYMGRLIPVAVVLSLLAFLACVLAGWRRPRLRALLAALAFAILLTYGVSHVMPMLMDRTILFTLALFLAILAIGLARLRRPVVLAVVALAAMLPQAKGSLNLLGATSFYGEQWDHAATLLEARVTPGEAIMTIGAFETTALDYYLRRGGRLRVTAAVGDLAGEVNTVAIELMTQAQPITRPLRPERFCAVLRGATGIWLASRPEASYPVLLNAVQQRLRETGAEPRQMHIVGSLPLSHWSAPTACR